MELNYNHGNFPSLDWNMRLFRNNLINNTLKVYYRGGVAEWLGRRTVNSEVAGSSPVLTTKLKLFLGRPWFNTSVLLVNNWSTSCHT